MKKNETKNTVTTNKMYSNDVAINEIFELAKKLDSKATLTVKQSSDEKCIAMFSDNGPIARSQVWFCPKKIDIYVGNNVANQSLANVAQLASVDNVGKAKHSKNEILLSYVSFDAVKSFFESVLSDMQKQSEKTEKKDTAKKDTATKKRNTAKKKEEKKAV